MRIKEIEARLEAIKQEIETRGADMTAAEIAALDDVLHADPSVIRVEE